MNNGDCKSKLNTFSRCRIPMAGNVRYSITPVQPSPNGQTFVQFLNKHNCDVFIYGQFSTKPLVTCPRSSTIREFHCTPINMQRYMLYPSLLWICFTNSLKLYICIIPRKPFTHQVIMLRSGTEPLSRLTMY